MQDEPVLDLTLHLIVWGRPKPPLLFLVCTVLVSQEKSFPCEISVSSQPRRMRVQRDAESLQDFSISACHFGCRREMANISAISHSAQLNWSLQPGREEKIEHSWRQLCTFLVIFMDTCFWIAHLDWDQRGNKNCLSRLELRTIRNLEGEMI